MGKAGVTGRTMLLRDFVSFLFASRSSANDGDGWACGRLRPGGIRGVEERTGESRELLTECIRDFVVASGSCSFAGERRGGKSCSSGKASVFLFGRKGNCKTAGTEQQAEHDFKAQKHLDTWIGIAPDIYSQLIMGQEKRWNWKA